MKLLMSQSDYDAMCIEADRMFPFETGGVLMGRRDGADLRVTHLIGPGPGATHERTCFEYDAEYVMGEIRRIVRETRGASIYLGDWHTHPNGDNVLSPQDMDILRCIGPAQPVVMIVARDNEGEPWEAWPWRQVGSDEVGLMTVELACVDASPVASG